MSAESEMPSRRMIVVSGRGTEMVLRVLLGTGGALLMLAGLLLTYPFGVFIFGVPLFALGIILATKAVFW
jgi:hypothetical protein